MNKSWLYLGVICGLAIVITSCGGDGGKPATTPPAASPSPSAVASPTPTAAVTPATPQPALTDKPPLVPAKSAARAISMDVTAGLIAPTDADNWTRTVTKGRPDPFAALALQPIQDPILVKEMASARDAKAGANQKLPITKVGSSVWSKPVKVAVITSARDRNLIKELPSARGAKAGVNQKLPITKVGSSVWSKPVKVATEDRHIDISQISRSRIALKPKPQSPNSTATIRSTSKPPIAFRPLPQPLKTPVRSTTVAPINSTTVAPPKLEPKLARAVGVSGIIQIDGRTQVIVKLPNESSSRYVDVGDRISDGKIMVKRVEGEQTLSPIVVLEESGMEVTHKVGDTGESTPKTAATEPSKTPPAIAPVTAPAPALTK